MTVIIGLEHEGKVWMGGDSASVSGYEIHKTDLIKVFITGKFLIGYTGSFRLGQLMEHSFSVRDRLPDEGEMFYLVTLMVPAIRDLLNSHGMVNTESGVDSIGSWGSLLLGYAGKLYCVDQDFHVNRNRCGFDTIGAGKFYALAAVDALSSLTPKNRIKKALGITARWSTVVCEPFHILNI